MWWPCRTWKKMIIFGMYFLLLKMSMLDLLVNFSYSSMTLLGAAAQLFRGMECFFLQPRLFSYSLPFWSEQNAGQMIHNRRKIFWWTSCFLKQYCFRKHASLDRKETIWHGIKYWAFYCCLFFGSQFPISFPLLYDSPSFWVLHLIIYTTYFYLLFSFNPVTTSMTPMWLFH